MKTLIGLLAAVSLNCSGLELALGSWSDHSSSKKSVEYNETHETIGVSINGYEIGTLINSYNSRSFYAGYNFQKHLFDSLDVGFRVGLITGYESIGRPVTPWAVPNATVWFGQVGVEVGALPYTYKGELSGVVWTYTGKVRF